jgi:site-specific recombinase XerD
VNIERAACKSAALFSSAKRRAIEKFMVHRSIGTTALYCDVSDETLRNAVELV